MQEAVAQILTCSSVSSVGYCPEIVLVRLVVRATRWEACSVTYIIQHSLIAFYSTIRRKWTTYNERPSMLLGPKSYRLGFWPVYKVCSLVPPSRKFEVAKFKVRPSKLINARNCVKAGLHRRSEPGQHGARFEASGAMQVSWPFPRKSRKFWEEYGLDSLAVPMASGGVRDSLRLLSCLWATVINSNELEGSQSSGLPETS